MGFEPLIGHTQLFLLIFARIFALLRIAPLISSNSFPGTARVGLALLSAVVVLPGMIESGYPIPEAGLHYAMLIVGEAMIGIITGFFLVIIYAAFLLAGQFFSLQMGFGASQVFDPLAQIQIPLMGQFLNMIAMFVFITTSGFQKIFLYGVDASFRAVRAVDLVVSHDFVLRTIFDGLGRLFEQSLVIAFPILGTLFLVSVSMGLLAKAAPQMNLLMFGFPVAISVAFFILFLSMPLLMQAFSRIIDASFEGVLRLLGGAGGTVGAGGTGGANGAAGTGGGI